MLNLTVSELSLLTTGRNIDGYQKMYRCLDQLIVPFVQTPTLRLPQKPPLGLPITPTLPLRPALVPFPILRPRHTQRPAIMEII